MLCEQIYFSDGHRPALLIQPHLTTAYVARAGIEHPSTTRSSTVPRAITERPTTLAGHGLPGKTVDPPYSKAIAAKVLRMGIDGSAPMSLDDPHQRAQVA